MSEGPDSAPLLMTLLPGVEAPVECEANLVRYFNSIIMQVLGNETSIAASGYKDTASLKNSRPCGLPL
jgi:hypothetical protein